ncbi:MAG: TIGR01777 family protein [Cyanobacterium sp. T60_A2020_053]|nr:TIGR01777 family protein [Cyanobacterium sp. T60_A2020_053]
MKIAITGATGFVGKALVEKLAVNHQILVLTRSVEKAKSVFPVYLQSNLEFASYTPKTAGDWQDKINGCDGVVNLAGAPIAEKWSGSYKQEILASRRDGTKMIVDAIKNSAQKPQFLINASAIGYYGTSETATYTEISPAGDDFLAQVCQVWEAEAEKVKEVGGRLVIFRFGIVLGMGGALAKMIPPFKIFAGGPIGEGKQWFSWIHIDDVVNLIVTAMENNNIEGTFNATAPFPVTMNNLCEKLGEVMKRPSWLPVPSFALELLLGEGAKVVLEGQKVLPEKTTEVINYNYQYPEIKLALTQIING